MKQKRTNIIIISIAVAAVIVGAIILIICLSGAKPTVQEPTIAPILTSSPSVTPTQTPQPTETPDTDVNAMFYSCGMVVASDKLSFGLSSNGLMSYIGSNNGQAYCYEWKDIIQFITTSHYSAGLTDYGAIVVSGDSLIAASVENWENVTSIYANDTALYGLTNRGDIYSTDNSTAHLSSIRLMAVGNDFLIAIDTANEIHTLGNAPDLSSWNAADITSISAGASHAVALTTQCQLLTTKADSSALLGLSNLAKVFACGNDTAVIDSAGTLTTDCEHIPAPIKNAVWFSSSLDHALVLLDDGKVLAYGDNAFMQCEVSNWRLRPYLTDDGWVLGLREGMQLGVDSSPVKTGDSYTLENGTSGTAVVLGDINMDGFITDEDKALLESYLVGDLELSSAQQRAANIIMDEAQPKAIDVSDVEQLRYHLLGFTIIDQYAKNYAYSGEVANAERINYDVMGYLRLDGTNIEYPIMYGDDFFYHFHNAAGLEDSRGSVYLYYPVPTRNIVITGHNMRVSGVMLHELHKIQDEFANEYDIFKNRLWQLNIYGETHYWEVFAMYEEKPNNASNSSQYYNTNYNFTMETMTVEEIQDWINYQIERTELNYTLHITPNDRFLTVLTCADLHSESNTGGRIYFFLRMMDGH